MQEFVNRLTGRTQQMQISAGSDDAIFGASRRALQEQPALTPTTRHLIGLWPILSETHPVQAMGLGLVLAALLERWEGIRILRLLAQVSGNPVDYTWTISSSQFGVDDWELEGLLENGAIWGQLTTAANNELAFSIFVENDLAEDEKEPTYYSIDGDDLADLMAKLPDLATRIAKHMDPKEPPPESLRFQPDDGEVSSFLARLFEWELRVYLSSWGQLWSSADLQRTFDEFLSSIETSPKLGAWVAAQSLRRAMLSGIDGLAGYLTSRLSELIDSVSRCPQAIAEIGTGIAHTGSLLDAIDLLEEHSDLAGGCADFWLTLSGLYLTARDTLGAVAALQRGLQDNEPDARLYQQYGDLLFTISQLGQSLPIGKVTRSAVGRPFVLQLSDRQGGTARDLVVESARAYRKSVDLRPDDPVLLNKFILALLETDADYSALLPAWERLLTVDEEGTHVRMIVDNLYRVNKVAPLINSIEEASARHPDRPDLLVNLAAAYLMVDDLDNARAALLRARKLSSDPQLEAEIDRLMLTASVPDFEARLGEITDLVSGENTLPSDDVEFLEHAIEQAPSFSPAYLLLASAYQKWGEDQDALEVLLDGRKELPNDAGILTALIRILSQLNEQELAIEYLNQGLKQFPNEVGILALAGKCLFDEGQTEESREYLARAESLEPQNQILAEVRSHIARRFAEGS